MIKNKNLTNRCFLLCMVILLFQTIQSQEIETIIQVGHTYPIVAYDVSPDGKYLASTDKTRKVVVWDLKRGKQLIHGLKPIRRTGRFLENQI